LNSAEMKQLARLLGNEDAFVDIYIADVQKMIRQEKLHLASIFQGPSVKQQWYFMSVWHFI